MENFVTGINTENATSQSLECWRKMCVARTFELNVKKAFDAKAIRCPIYLSLGQESIPAAVSTLYKNPAIFAQHRAHSTYLSFGGDPETLIDELLLKPTGCSGGMGGSASIQDKSISMFGHTGFIGDQIPISVGFALGAARNVLTIFGDAAAEEDYAASSIGYAAHKKLPILFVCEDNNLSILTEVKVRRSWKIVDVARAMGVAAEDISDDPWEIMQSVSEMIGHLPALLNIHTIRHLWHSGTGIDGAPAYDRFLLTREKLSSMGLSSEVAAIEDEAAKRMENLWQTKVYQRVS
ncbi:MAG: thiamine pyrophosphate-dependent enzyme [Patescibacteria group bacterium]